VSAILESDQLVKPVRITTPWLIWQFQHEGYRFLVEETRSYPNVMPEFEWWLDYEKLDLAKALTPEEYKRWELDLCEYQVTVFHNYGENPPDIYIADAITRVVNALVPRAKELRRSVLDRLRDRAKS